MELFALFFMAGMGVGVIGGLARVWMWISGQKITDIVTALASAVFSRKIYYILKGLFVGTLLKPKLRSRDLTSGGFKALFILCYLGIIIAYHVKVESMHQLRGLPFYLLFFHAPFADFYFLRDITIENFGLVDALYGFLNDLFATIVILYDIFVVYRRFIGKKIHLKIVPQDVFCDVVIILWFIFRFAAETSTILAFNVPPSIARYWFIGYAVSLAVKPLNLQWITYYTVLWPLSGLFLGTLIASIPFTKLWHLLIAPIQIMRRHISEIGPGLPFGRELSTPFDLKKLIESESFDVKVGADRMEDFDWRRRISLDSCMACGRCQDVCPAYAAGRDLSPSEVIIALEKALKDTFIAKLFRSKKVVLLDGRIKEDTVWACTTCAACIKACPVDICQPDFLLEFRRTFVANNKLDDLKIKTLMNFAEKSNPYGMPAIDRANWAKGLEVKTLKEDQNVEYLYWVGCASSYDSRNQNIAKSMVKILKKAGVSFGILGDEEKCCGETPRRMGEEGRFQELAMANIETMKRCNVKKIIVHCPHGYNTLKNEYPRFGGEFEVIHHSEFLLKLIREGKIKVSREIEEGIAFHDPCYLGRYNGIYDAPRQVLSSIPTLKIRELARTRDNSFCCGGGGGNAWYEVHEKERISVLRIKEMEEAGVKRVSVACPYCISMFEDAIKIKGLEEKLSVKDIAEILAESMGN